MQIPSSMPRLKGFRFPREIVSYAVWACHRFALSTADGEEDPDLIRGIKSPTNGDTPDILVQTRRNAKAAKRFLTRLIALSGQPRVVITDKRRSYTKPIARLAPGADHPAHEGLNNRIEGSHRPTRRREKIMGRFNSPDRHGASLPPMTRSTRFSNPAAITSQSHPIAMPGPTPSGYGQITHSR
jgi:putative transposase